MKITKGISQKTDGSMKVYPKNNKEQTVNNRKNFLQNIGLSADDLVIAGLEHGNSVLIVNTEDRGKITQNCDGLVTNTPGLILGITAADCLPIYFWNKQGTVLGLAHAGWRGVFGQVAREVVEKMVGKCGCKLEDIEVEIGPHILDCHFEIQDDLVEKFADYPGMIGRDDNKKYLSLAGVVEYQLLKLGLLKKNIFITEECTHCLPGKYFSYRRDKPTDIEAMLAYISLVR